MTPEEIRDIQPINDPRDFQFWLREIAAQLAEQNEQIRADRKFREAVRKEQRAEVKKQQEFIALSAGGLEAFRKSVEDGPPTPPRVVFPGEVLHLGCIVREPDGTHCIATHTGERVELKPNEAAFLLAIMEPPAPEQKPS